MSALPHSGAGLALGLLALFCLPALAAAHASLIESDPPAGGTIETPYLLTARFDEDLGAGQSRIIVRDATGNEVARGGVSEDDPRLMMVDLPAALPPGEYVARWTAFTPADTGITRGNIEFTIAQATSPSPTPAPTPTVAPSASSTAPTTAGPTGSAAPSATVTVGPTASPSPTPSNGGQPMAGTTDLLIALLLAGAAVAALLFFLWRRRAA